MDVVPGAYVEEDIAEIRANVDRVLEKHGVDGTPYRKALTTGPREHLQSATAGVSFYAPPFMSVTAKNFDVVTETFTALFDAYMEIVEKRAGQNYSAEDVAAQDAMRRRWLEDQMLIDPFAMNVFPYEVRSFQNFPPTVKY
jgi:coproporphyrinogen III oxidase